MFMLIKLLADSKLCRLADPWWQLGGVHMTRDSPPGMTCHIIYIKDQDGILWVVQLWGSMLHANEHTYLEEWYKED